MGTVTDHLPLGPRVGRHQQRVVAAEDVGLPPALGAAARLCDAASSLLDDYVRVSRKQTMHIVWLVNSPFARSGSEANLVAIELASRYG